MKCTEAVFGVADGVLALGGRALVAGLPAGWSLEAGPGEGVAWLRLTASSGQARHRMKLGRLELLERFTALHRPEPYWIIPCAGGPGTAVPAETQFLLARRTDGWWVAVVPVLDGAFRAALKGADGGGLEVVVESGDAGVVTAAVVPVLVGVGHDPYELMPRAAAAVLARGGSGRARAAKPVPAFADDFGWCTWDAFYHEVSHEKVREGLESFRAAGIPVRTMILDDGWQSEERQPTGERRLTSLSPNAKFGGDLGPTVRMAKGEHGLRTFLVWHAMTGYWGGVAPGLGFAVRDQERVLSPEMAKLAPWAVEAWGGQVGLVPGAEAARFFDAYHDLLRRQGVDGVKVDTQATLESVARGEGGRVELMRAYRRALEGSVQVHFGGNLINCMSDSNDMLYQALASNLTRSSTDFWPNKPESHGLHIFTNAQFGAWFGEFVHPDWDMFQSGHPRGAFHAAGRAVSGGPVYVSDKPGTHDAALLRRLVLPDGTVLRARGVARPTADCLLVDPTREDVALKVFNRNAAGAVVGVFHCRWETDGRPVGPLTARVSALDIPDFPGERFAVHVQGTDVLEVRRPGESVDVTLEQLTAEVVTVSPVVDGFAVVGAVGYLNPGGAVGEVRRERGGWRVRVKRAGRLVAWSETPPRFVTADGAPVSFTHEHGGRLDMDLGDTGAWVTLDLGWS